MPQRPPRYLALAIALAACGSDPSSGPLGGSLTVTGDVYDFQTGTPVSGTAMISTSALVPPPNVSVEGAAYTIEGVPENSAFQILASVSPSHRATFNATTEVFDADVDGVKTYAVSEDLLAALATAFGVTPAATSGIVFMQLVDAGGAPKANVAGSNIVLTGVTGAAGVKFLDASLGPAPSLMASSTSGWAVIFNVPPGVVSLGTAANATASLAAPSAPVAASSVTLVRATVTDGAPPALPTNISFSAMVVPIFSDRGCVACHSGNGPGKDLGGLMLDGGDTKIHRELTLEDPLRAQPAMPEKSLVLTMPSAESPPDAHPNVTFTGPQDPDYIKLLVWLREGAKAN